MWIQIIASQVFFPFSSTCYEDGVEEFEGRHLEMSEDITDEI
jgi:hypothetical protein